MFSPRTELLMKADTTLARIYSDYRRLGRALVVGVLATIVDTAFLMLFTGYFNVDPVPAKAMSFLIGMSVSFYLNRTFTFRNTSDKPHYQFVSFAIIGFTQYLLTLALFGLFVHVIFNNESAIYLMITNVLVAFIGFFYAFTLNKSLTFKIFK
jgi:putative flippase GtrA